MKPPFSCKPSYRSRHLGVLLLSLFFVGFFSGNVSASSKTPIAVPPPELVLHSNAFVPQLAAYTLSTVYGLSLGLYAGTVAVPVVLGARHQQSSSSMTGAFLGAALGGAFGFAYSAMGEASLENSHGLVHYQSLGLLSGIGLGNFFGSRGHTDGLEYNSGLLGSLGGVLLALGMKSAGLHDHGSLLWGTYATLLTAAGTLPMGLLLQFDNDAILGLGAAPAGLVGLLTSLVLAPLKPDPVKASIMFLSSSFLGATSAFSVALGSAVFGDLQTTQASQALAGLAGAGLGLIIAPVIHDWVSLKWIDRTEARKKSAARVMPWADTVRPFVHLGERTPISTLGIKWFFD